MKQGDRLHMNGKLYIAVSEAQCGSCRGCDLWDGKLSTRTCDNMVDHCARYSLIWKEVRPEGREHEYTVAELKSQLGLEPEDTLVLTLDAGATLRV